jgi:DNA-binding HxlR family transcriptional regulator
MSGLGNGLRSQDACDEWSSGGVNAVVALISRRWVLPILRALEDGPLRRNALRERLGAVSDKVITETLRRMEGDSLILRTAIASVPVEVDYELTSFAWTLWPLLGGMERWALAGLAKSASDPSASVVYSA